MPQNDYGGSHTFEPIAGEKALYLLFSAPRPLILGGGGVMISDAMAELKVLATYLDISVYTTLMDKGTMSESDDLCPGLAGCWGTIPLPKPHISTGGLAAMGFGICGISRAKPAWLESAYVSVCSDGGFIMTPYAVAFEEAIKSGRPAVMDVITNPDTAVPITATWQMPPIRRPSRLSDRARFENKMH
jgi:thiamine pyrophosphate-dependent acetolactate synthase large subunit-like protein